MIVPDKERSYDVRQAAYSGNTGSTGSVSTLPMTDDEKKSVVHRPIGFAPQEES